MNAADHWRPAGDITIEGRTMRAVKPHDGTQLRAVCVDDLPDGDCRAVVEGLHGSRPLVDGSCSWAFASDVRRLLRRRDESIQMVYPDAGALSRRVEG